MPSFFLINRKDDNMATVRKPNTICRNPNCTNGTDGGRKHFYACMTCLRNENWRAYCCSRECYEEYTRIILFNRNAAREEKFPERTDMTLSEMEAVFEKPVAEVQAYTAEYELKDYFEENPDMPLADIIDKVNEDIDASTKKQKKKN